MSGMKKVNTKGVKSNQKAIEKEKKRQKEKH